MTSIPAQNNIIQLYLEHIRLELQHGVSINFNYFALRYLCHRDGLLSKTGTPRLDCGLFSGKVSARARELRLSGSRGWKKLLVCLPVVPTPVIQELLQSGYQAKTVMTGEDVRAVLDCYLSLVTITKAELASLSRIHKDSVPAGFFDSADDDSRFQLRFLDAGIDLQPPTSSELAEYLQGRST